MKKVFSKFDVAKAFYSIGEQGFAFPLHRNKLWFLSVQGSSYGFDFQSVGDDLLYKCVV